MKIEHPGPQEARRADRSLRGLQRLVGAVTKGLVARMLTAAQEHLLGLSRLLLLVQEGRDGVVGQWLAVEIAQRPGSYPAEHASPPGLIAR